MKEIIKITIALAFILSAYILGSHQNDEKHQLKTEKLNNIISFGKTNISKLQDSISKLRHIIDSLKVEPVNVTSPPTLVHGRRNNKAGK